MQWEEQQENHGGAHEGFPGLASGFHVPTVHLSPIVDLHYCCDRLLTIYFLIADSGPAENSYCLELPMRNTPLFRTLTILTAILAVSRFSALAFGQGCVA